MSLGPIVRFWAAADYDPDLRFFDHLYSAAQRHRSDFEHWWTNRLSVVLHDYKRHELLGITSKRAHCEAANPDDLDSSVRVLAGSIDKILTELNQNIVKRMGLQLIVYADLGLTFEELVSRFRPFCLPENERLEGFTSTKITDIALHFDYELADRSARFRAGPMNKEQGLERLRSVGDHGRLFTPSEQGTGLADFYSQIPETFLYFDLEVYTEQEQGSKQWRTFVQQAFEHGRKAFEGFRAIIMEE